MQYIALCCLSLKGICCCTWTHNLQPTKEDEMSSGFTTTLPKQRPTSPFKAKCTSQKLYKIVQIWKQLKNKPPFSNEQCLKCVRLVIATIRLTNKMAANNNIFWDRYFVTVPLINLPYSLASLKCAHEELQFWHLCTGFIFQPRRRSLGITMCGFTDWTPLLPISSFIHHFN